MESGGSAVRVLVRCRPLLPREASGATATLRIDRTASTIGVGVPGSSSETRFRFDGVADVTCTQDDVYELGGVGELVGSTVGGYHATIFAYGQTASGKTFTMEGFEYGRDRLHKPIANLRTDPRRLGIIPRALDELFSRVAADAQAGGHARVRLSYFQLYKEQIYDLLSTSTPVDRAPHAGGGGAGRPRRGLRLRWAAGREFYVENLSEYEVHDVDEALELFRIGVAHKAMAETQMNAASSRSHCVLSLSVDSLDGAHGSVTHSGTLSLVDLAGSERQPKGVERSANLVDSVEINRSLFALRKVIVALSAGGARQPHVPYRDSILTKVLKGSLGGSARTLMIACISIADEASEESASTLAYAARARTITNVPVRNADPRLSELALLRAQCADLRAEVARLTRLLAEGLAPAAETRAPSADDATSVRPAAPPITTRAGSDGGGGGSGGDGLTPRWRIAGDARAANGAGAARGSAGANGGTVDAAAHRRLGERFVESVGALRTALLSQAALRESNDLLAHQRARTERAHAELMADNTALADRVRMLEAVALMEAYPLEAYPDGRCLAPRASSGSVDGEAGSAEQMLLPMLKRAVQEAIVLRAENEQLRDALSATPSLAAPAPAAPGGGGRTSACARTASAGTAASAGAGRPSVHRLSSAGRLVPQHALLHGSEQLAMAPDERGLDALAAADAQRATRSPRPPSAARDAHVPVPGDTFANLEQLAVLLRQRADLSRHTQLIAALSKR
ncbi:hypothetical protein KFE25_010261 [Diacronema lutheri]|uniref:Kinesin-like protein n=1 Tax=Diacronema lutheri TaxID=2081491 RepID=A0A8J5XI86_DIALT|nr:hypothetical protein KFE25_010261 [Diacronema lutheri]